MANDGGEMWLSQRKLFRTGDPGWNSYVQFVGLSHLQEVRTIDLACNPCLDGNYPINTLEELWELENRLLPRPRTSSDYWLLFTDTFGTNKALAHSRLTLLGYDLSDETWTSSLLNCGRWEGALEPIARRTGRNGLLSLEDAKLAQALLPEVWDGDPHSHVNVWALFEVVPPES